MSDARALEVLFNLSGDLAPISIYFENITKADMNQIIDEIDEQKEESNCISVKGFQLVEGEEVLSPTDASFTIDSDKVNYIRYKYMTKKEFEELNND